MPRVQWTAVAQRPHTDSMWRVIDAARKSKGRGVTEQDVGEIVGRLVQTMPPSSRNELIAKLSVDERTSATSWLEVFEHERIEASLNAFHNIFRHMAISTDLQYHSEGRRTRRDGEETLEKCLFSEAFSISPGSILGLQGGHFLFLKHYKDLPDGAQDGFNIAESLLEQIGNGKKFKRRLVQDTIREVLGGRSRTYNKSDEDEIIKGFTELFMMAKG